MTLFGLDVSNHQSADGFDGAAALAEGFSFVTHKVAEGTWRDPHWARERDETWPLFPRRFGGYVFHRVAVPPADELGVTAEHARASDGRLPPLQLDYEDKRTRGSIDDLWARITEAQRLGFWLLPIYLPRWYWRDWMGSPDLSDLPVGIWNSHYVRGTGYASALYPGDQFAGWADMGGKRVEFLQFTDTAIAAGENPCDANAFRGTESELDALFGAGKRGTMSEAAQALEQLLGTNGEGFAILGTAVETDPGRHRFLTEAVAVALSQLCGDANFGGWAQLGTGEAADAARAERAELARRTLVDGLAYAIGQNERIIEQNGKILAQGADILAALRELRGAVR